MTKEELGQKIRKEGRLCLFYRTNLQRLGYRQTWDEAFFNYLKNLEREKPVMVELKSK